jgi:hypothetical protein
MSPFRRKSGLPVLPIYALALSVSTGCADRFLGDDDQRDPNPPSLVVTAPERGLQSESQSLRVTGRVSDVEGGPVAVSVNDVGAKVSNSGEFQVDLNLAAGMTLLQVIAEDESGNQTRDTRAVLAGQLAPIDRPVREAMVAHLGGETFAALASITGAVAESTDLAAAVTNPIFTKGGSCLGIAIDVDRIAKSAVDVELIPVGGGLRIRVDVFDLEVEMTGDYNFSCAGDDFGIDIDADRFSIEGTVGLDLAGEVIEIAVDVPTASFANFNLRFGAVPTQVSDLFESQIGDVVADKIAEQIEKMVPPLASSFLADLTGSAFSLPILGQELEVRVTPRAIDFDTQGGTVALDTDVRIAGVTGPGYVYTPAPMPSAVALRAAGQGFRIGVADDAVNQIFASLHASGILAKSFRFEDGTGPGALLGENIDRLDLRLLLPPVFRADLEGGAVEVVIGDMLIDLVDETDAAERLVTRVAVSGRLQLAARIDGGRVRFQTTAPELWVDIAREGVEGGNPLAHDQIEALASAATANVAAVVDDFLAGVPIPVFSSTTVTEAAFEPELGYVLIGGSLGPDL